MNVWSDKVAFNLWLTTVFLHFICKYTSGNVALTIYNCSPHEADVEYPRGDGTILICPPNYTSAYQPMKMGIIAARKVRFKASVMRKIFQDLESTHSRCDEFGSVRRGMQLLTEGTDSDMLYVMERAAESWGSLTESTIARCWLKSHCPPCSMEANLFAQVACETDVVESSDINTVLELN